MAKCIQQDGEFSVLEAKLTRCWKSDHAIYEIEIKSKENDIYWSFSKRYSEFLQLHESLCKIDDSLKQIYFPPKKSFNNLSIKFLCKRRQELEEYLNILLKKFPIPPASLGNFIDWNQYEIHGITNNLARKFFQNGDLIIKEGFQFEFSVLQIYSINQRLQSQSPTNLSNDPSLDFVHVMEFVGRVRNVKVTGSSSAVGTSNIVMNKLELDMSRFHSVDKLEMTNVNLKYMRGFENLKETVKLMKVSSSLYSVKLLAIGDLLSIGNGDWVFGRDSVPTNCWLKVEHLDLSNNFLQGLDPSMTLFKKVRTVKLNNNLLVDVQHLDILENLRVLNLSQNKLGLVYTSSNRIPEPTLRGRLGNITDLDLSYNELCSARLVEGLYSLIKLNLGGNKIEEIEELESLATLQCLESLILLGNPICIKSGYRKSTLELFGERFNEIKLDLRAADEIEFRQLQASISESIILKNKFQNEICRNNANNEGDASILSTIFNNNNQANKQPAYPTDGCTNCASRTLISSYFDKEDASPVNLEVSLESDVNEIIIF